jgi:hypothetical protein
MKNSILITFILTIFISLAHIDQSSAQAMQEKDFIIHGGIGTGYTFGWGGGFALPIGAGAEYGISSIDKGVLGIGGELGYIGFTGGGVTIFGGRANYHFSEFLNMDSDKLDLYAGLGIYYRNFSTGFLGTSVGGVNLAFNAGARYYFAESLAAYAELGNNWAWLNLGVAFRIR